MKPAWHCMLCHQSDEPHRRRDICDNCDDGLVARGLAWCTKKGIAFVYPKWCIAGAEDA